MSNIYKVKARLFENKYGPFVEEFKQHNDDRILVANILGQVLEACKAMELVENNLVRVAINEKLREEDSEMEEIVTRFTGKVFVGTKWYSPDELAVLQSEAETVSYRELSDALEEIQKRLRDHKIMIENLTDMKTHIVKLGINWFAIGSTGVSETKDFARWLKEAADAVKNFRYNGCRVVYGEEE